jgi:hypothetical protein
MQHIRIPFYECSTHDHNIKLSKSQYYADLNQVNFFQNFFKIKKCRGLQAPQQAKQAQQPPMGTKEIIVNGKERNPT